MFTTNLAAVRQFRRRCSLENTCLWRLSEEWTCFRSNRFTISPGLSHIWLDQLAQKAKEMHAKRKRTPTSNSRLRVQWGFSPVEFGRNRDPYSTPAIWPHQPGVFCIGIRHFVVPTVSWLMGLSWQEASSMDKASVCWSWSCFKTGARKEVCVCVCARRAVWLLAMRTVTRLCGSATHVSTIWITSVPQWARCCPARASRANQVRQRWSLRRTWAASCWVRSCYFFAFVVFYLMSSIRCSSSLGVGSYSRLVSLATHWWGPTYLSGWGPFILRQSHPAWLRKDCAEPALFTQ